jgi:hypothetical protein
MAPLRRDLTWAAAQPGPRVRAGTDAPSGRLVGRIRQHEYEAIADPPDDFRVLALTRAARYRVTTLSRRAERAHWRNVDCWVLQRDDAVGLTNRGGPALPR